MGTAQLIFVEVVRGATTGSMLCACPVFPHVFFLTRAVVQNVVQ